LLNHVIIFSVPLVRELALKVALEQTRNF